MSIDMYLSDSKKQASSVSTMCKSQVEGYEGLQKAINDFVLNSMQLKGQTYDSAKAYFSGVLLPLSKGGMLLSEAVEKSVKKFPEDYVAQVDSCSLKESKLEEQIQQADTAITRINAIRESISKLDSKDFNTTVMLVTNSAVLGIYSQIKQDLTEKLEKLRLFNATSPTIFSEIASLTEAINQGIAQTKTAFNASTGTFTMPSQENMAWARTINDYEQKQIEEKDKELLKGCTIIRAYDKSQNFEHYMLEKDGHCYYVDEKELSGTLKELASKYGMTVLEISPKDLTARVNNYQKSGKNYFTGKKFPIPGVGALSHGQDCVESLKESGVWDAMITVGFTVAAVRNAQTFDKTTSKTIKTNKSNKLQFKNTEKLETHFTKHGAEMKQALNKNNYTQTNYLNDANHVIKEGQYVPEMNGYVKLVGGKGSAKYAFVGLDKSTGDITTLHLKSVKELSKKAPSLGLEP